MTLRWRSPGGHQCVLGLGLRGFWALRVGWEHGERRRALWRYLGMASNWGVQRLMDFIPTLRRVIAKLGQMLARS